MGEVGRSGLYRWGREGQALHQTSLSYVESWYAGDAARMERALHPELAKRFFRVLPSGTRFVEEVGASLTSVVINRAPTLSTRRSPGDHAPDTWSYSVRTWNEPRPSTPARSDPALRPLASGTEAGATTTGCAAVPMPHIRKATEDGLERALIGKDVATSTAQVQKNVRQGVANYNDSVGTG